MDASYARAYAELYHHHWWWRSREAILLEVIRSLDLARDCRILDVGCGDGLFLPRLAEFGHVRGLESDPQVLHGDGPMRDRIVIGSLAELAESEAGTYDLITALDVLEHIEDDAAAADDLGRLLAAGGRLLVTVPAFQLLWDAHDELNHHHRRYTRGQLRDLLAPQGRLLEVRYLFHAIFALKLGVKVLNRGLRAGIAQHRLPSPALNRAMRWLCGAEHRLLGRLRIPFGTSVMALLAR